MQKIRIVTMLIALCSSFNLLALETVAKVDLQKYTGKWYEIARFENWFEKDCTNVTAEYSLLEEQNIKVVNSCYLKTPNGKFKQAEGVAWVVDPATNAKLKVSFLPNYLSWFDKVFAGDYWILKLAPDYSVVLVGEPSLEYLWILSRNPVIDEKIYAEYVDSAKELGFATEKLHRTTQEWQKKE